MEPIEVNEKDVKWVKDPKGFFTIKPFFGDKKVFVRHYTNDMKLKHLFSGENTSAILQKILSMDLVSLDEHIGYLGKEIEKAVIALENKIEYVQDKDLDFSKTVIDENKLNECYVEK